MVHCAVTFVLLMMHLSTREREREREREAKIGREKMCLCLSVRKSDRESERGGREWMNMIDRQTDRQIDVYI